MPNDYDEELEELEECEDTEDDCDSVSPYPVSDLQQAISIGAYSVCS